MSEPTDVIIAGESYAWTRKFSLYPATAWTLTYQLVGLGHNTEITSTPNGDSFDVVLTRTQTEALTAGKGYRLIGRVDNVVDPEQRKIVYSQTIEVAPDVTKVVDLRTYAQRTLAAIEAVIEKTASKDQQTITVDGQTLVRRSPDQLLKLRDRFQREVRDEERDEAIASGKCEPGRVQMRFRS